MDDLLLYVDICLYMLYTDIYICYYMLLYAYRQHTNESELRTVKQCYLLVLCKELTVRGSRMDPCGTTILHCLTADVDLLTQTVCALPSRYEPRQSNALQVIPKVCFKHRSMADLSRVLKAAYILRAASTLAFCVQRYHRCRLVFLKCRLSRVMNSVSRLQFVEPGSVVDVLEFL